MAKNKKKKGQKKQSQKKQVRGFDFGIKPKAMAMSDMEFSQDLRDAGVVGCAYGYQQLDGIEFLAITLVGTSRDAFARAYKRFVLWGCEEDGDVVDVNILLKSDGSYDISIGPELRRSVYRTIPQSDLVDMVSMNTSWIKHIDSTSQFVHDIKKHCQSNKLHPILFMAATSSEENIKRMQYKSGSEPVTEPEPVPNWNGILKFGVRILTESEASLSSNPAFSVMLKQSNKKKVPPIDTPNDLCVRRTKTLDVAFPVYRERILRSSIVDQVREISGFEDVSKNQVCQAAINLMLSNQLIPDDKHYSKVTGDYFIKIWDAIAERADLADGLPLPSFLEPEVIAFQIELDVWATLKKMEKKCKRESFSRLQKIFRQKGYIDD